MRLIRTALLAVLAFGASASAADVRGTATAGGKSIADAVVWFDAPGAPAPSTRPKVVLDQRNLTFSPRVLVVQVGTTVEFPNNDRVFHDVFSFRDGKRFGLGLYPVGVVKHVLFDQPGLSRLFCNIHPNMAAYIMVVDTPYFALSDREGRFSIADLPAGPYTYRAWRPGGEILTGSVAVSSGSSLDLRWP